MKTCLSLAFSIVCLLVSACTGEPASVVPPTGVPTSVALPTGTVTASSLEGPDLRQTTAVTRRTPSVTPIEEDFTFSGDFALSNTSTPGMEAGIETLQFVLESRLSTAAQWEKIEVECSFDPPAPFVLKGEQAVHYECLSLHRPPAGAELRAAVEVKVFGVQEIFRKEIALP